MRHDSCSAIGTVPISGVVNLLLRGGKMDVTKILTELRQEREQIEEAIMSLERLARGRGRRRGRPPAWMAEIEKKRGRPPGSKNKTSTIQKAMGMV
jgi:DNA invertase Pin-like site-specific DNA recombinase